MQQGVHNSKAVIAPSKPATPIVFHTAQGHHPTDAHSANSTAIQGAKRVHRRRSRKSPEHDLQPAGAAAATPITDASHIEQQSQQPQQQAAATDGQHGLKLLQHGADPSQHLALRLQ